jgi:hypothetical protein
MLIGIAASTAVVVPGCECHLAPGFVLWACVLANRFHDRSRKRRGQRGFER